MNNAVLLVSAIAVLYLALAVLVAAGGMKYRRRGKNNSPLVSIVVCARNEESALPRCLDSLAVLDYPVSRREIILVNDESVDGTAALIAGFAARVHNVVTLSTSADSPSLPGKQRPLALAMRHARGEYILMTDADCAVHPSWIKRHIEAYDADTGVVGGITGIDYRGRGLFARLHNCDQVSKLAVARGAAGLGMIVTVMGNNMSFRRAAWIECGGFERIGPTIVEDVDLMLAIVRGTKYGLGWISERGAGVVSLPMDSFRRFIDQRRRMLRIQSGIPASAIALIAVECAMYATILSAPFMLPGDWRASLAFIAWCAGQAVMSVSAVGWRRSSALYLSLLFVFQAVYGIALALSMTFGGAIPWKGRDYR